jgi:hypothetical protein
MQIIIESTFEWIEGHLDVLRAPNIQERLLLSRSSSSGRCLRVLASTEVSTGGVQLRIKKIAIQINNHDAKKKMKQPVYVVKIDIKKLSPSFRRPKGPMGFRNKMRRNNLKIEL